MSDPKGANRRKSGAKRNALRATAVPAVASARTSRRSSCLRLTGEAGPAPPVSQKQGSVVDADAGEEDVLVYCLGKRDKVAWVRPRKQGKYEMVDIHWQGKLLKALAAR